MAKLKVLSYKRQNGISRMLNIVTFPFSLDPQEAHSRIEDCLIKSEVRATSIDPKTNTL